MNRLAKFLVCLFVLLALVGVVGHWKVAPSTLELEKEYWGNSDHHKDSHTNPEIDNRQFEITAPKLIEPSELKESDRLVVIFAITGRVGLIGIVASSLLWWLTREDDKPKNNTSQRVVR